MNIKNLKILGFIPARNGSKRIKNKNLRLFKNKPLIYYTINASIKSKYISKTVVYSDSKKINNFANKYKIDINCYRPKLVSRDKTSMYETIRYFLNKNKQYKNYDFFALLQPTSPLRTYTDINKAVIKLCKDKKAEGIVSTFKIKKLNKNYPNKFMFQNKKYLKKTKLMKSSNLKKLYLRNGPAIFIFKPKRLKKNLYNIKLLNYVMEEKKSLDINYPEELNPHKYL